MRRLRNVDKRNRRRVRNVRHVNLRVPLRQDEHGLQQFRRHQRMRGMRYVGWVTGNQLRKRLRHFDVDLRDGWSERNVRERSQRMRRVHSVDRGTGNNVWRLRNVVLCVFDRPQLHAVRG